MNALKMAEKVLDGIPPGQEAYYIIGSVLVLIIAYGCLK